nr:MAG: hypothetical protein 1 [Leviviridae sp.]
MTRIRQRNANFTGYRTERFGAHVTNSRTIEVKFEECTDETFTGDCWPFIVIQRYRVGGLINGISGSSLTGYTWNNYPCAYVTDSFLMSALSISGQPNNGTIAAKTIARTTPYRSSTVSLEYISEMPGYGKSAKKLLTERCLRLSKSIPERKWRTLSTIAKFTILTEFGIIPVLSDIEVLIEFRKRADARRQEIDRLYGKRGLRRTIKEYWSGSSSQSNVTGQVIQSQGVVLTCNVHKTTKRTISSHIRWYALFPMSRLTDSEIDRKIKAAILGYDINPYTIWQLIPWSWLIDYFTNLGDLLKGCSNMYEIRHDPVNVMTTTYTNSWTDNHSVHTNSSGMCTCTPMYISSIRRDRVYATPSIIALDCVLTRDQLSILGSLAVIRSIG